MPIRLPFPSTESELDNYFKQCIAHLEDNKVRLQIPDEDITTALSILARWNTYFLKAQNLDLRTKSITQNKNESREDLIALMRKIYKNIPDRLLLVEDRVLFNLPKKKGYRSAPPVAETVPIVTVYINNRLEHTIKFFNSGAAKSKPYLTRGCQIWYKIGEPPADIEDMRYMITASKSPHIHHFKGIDIGKTVYYWARWENSAGKTGAWSAVVQATIAG
jgi:hypothetical protein